MCRPHRNAQREITGYRHHLVLAAVVGGVLTLPVDVEPYGPGDSEYAAGQRLLHRVRANLGMRFIDYVVVDGEFATAPFLHAARKAGWPVVARLNPCATGRSAWQNSGENEAAPRISTGIGGDRDR